MKNNRAKVAVFRGQSKIMCPNHANTLWDGEQLTLTLKGRGEKT